ncbi:response regulator transcription factor [Sutcliffiella cohnii]|uniref:response regulator transcription factor n=1 Tax=Sutcliffiella cohnii TaxID=33932 RepID=UPI000835DA69|nr:response regulator transcription factor [Sutcliffiella cohnii]
MKLAILDDQSIMREGLKQILTLRYQKMNLSVKTYSSTEIIKLKSELPEYLLIDISADLDDVYELIEFFVSNHTQVIVFTNEIKPSIVLRTIRKGISGYMLKNMRTQELLKGMDVIFKNCTFFHHQISELIVNEYMKVSNLDNSFRKEQELKYNRPLGKFTNREWEVLDLLAKGYTNMMIGNHLNISDKTVKVHVANILKKLKVNDRTSAVIIAVKMGWTDLPDDKGILKLTKN